MQQIMNYWKVQQLPPQLDLRQHQEIDDPFIPLQQLRWPTQEKKKKRLDLPQECRDMLIVDMSKSNIDLILSLKSRLFKDCYFFSYSTNNSQKQYSLFLVVLSNKCKIVVISKLIFRLNYWKNIELLRK